MEAIVNTQKDLKELCSKYSWFAESYPPAIQKACDKFFLPGFQFILLGICKNINTLMVRDSYFVTKVRMDEMYDIFFRFSEKSVGFILEKTLGKPNSKFSLNKLTDLEAKIITAFNDYLYESITKYLCPAPPILKRTNFDVINLTFLVKDLEKGDVARFIVTIPEERLNPEVVQENEENTFSESDFYECTVISKIRVGTTRFKVIDLKNIEVDDIVLFEESDINHMLLLVQDYEMDINLNPNTDIIIPLQDNEGEDEMTDNTNIWDSIEVDMVAEFDAVKISLGDLKKIEQGMVMDITSIYDNKVILRVDNKDIARGELVIVNDRYGVKVKEIVANSPEDITVDDGVVNIANSTEEVNNAETIQSSEDAQETAVETQQGEAPAANEEDEFDYSDFELEDEDI